MNTADKKKFKPLKSWQLAFIYACVWLISIVGVYLISDIVLGSLLLHIAFVMLIVPIATLSVMLIYTRKCGINPWLSGMLTLIVLILYFAFGFNELKPNFLITSLLTGFFGAGLGNIFKDEASIAVQQDIDSEKKKKTLEAEKNYVPILEDKKKTK